MNATADQGRENELVMLLDYNEERSLTPPNKKETASNSTTITRLNFDHAKNQHERAKIKIHTLSNYEGYGGGSYKMTAVKRMTATNAFLNMPFKHRGCNLELFQECKTRRILEKCKCVPAELQASVGRDPKEYMRCTPKGRDCIQKIKLREDFNCSATCEGLHAVVLFDTDPLNKMISRGQLDNALEANNGNSKVFKYASKPIKEYRAFKKNMVRSFNFEPTSQQTHFGALIQPAR